MNDNFEQIKAAAEGYKADMSKYLRDLIAIPSESCEEEGVIRRTIAEMEKLGYDKAEIDPEGNALGWMGTGDKIIAFDGHIDTVGIGNINNWEHDPYKG
jgi:acetylornithine deacetylase/succinyl-diaminopimelate desuccinylase-like protein